MRLHSFEPVHFFPFFAVCPSQCLVSPVGLYIFSMGLPTSVSLPVLLRVYAPSTVLVHVCASTLLSLCMKSVVSVFLHCLIDCFTLFLSVDMSICLHECASACFPISLLSHQSVCQPVRLSMCPYIIWLPTCVPLSHCICVYWCTYLCLYVFAFFLSVCICACR